MAFLQIKVAEEVRLWERQWVLPARGQLWPKKRDWDPHGQHGKAKHSFIFLSQGGGMGSSCFSINGGDPISGHICLQELKIISELASRPLTTPQHLRAIPPIAPLPLSSQDQMPWEDRNRFSHHMRKGDRSYLRQGQTHRITEFSGLEGTSGHPTLLRTKEWKNQIGCLVWPIIQEKNQPNSKLLNYWEFSP